MLPNFQLIADGPISNLFKERGITDFKTACEFIQDLPIGRVSPRIDFKQVFELEKGTCSTKHAILNQLAEENGNLEIELMFGLYLMNGETHPHLAEFFSDKPYPALPESNCFLRYKGKRYDFTTNTNILEKIESKIIREQRIEPQQVGDWKEKLHQDFLMRWLKRKPEIEISLEDIWNDREKIQELNLI